MKNHESSTFLRLFYRGLVGGTKFARKSFTVNFVVAARDGRIAEHQDDTTTLIAA